MFQATTIVIARKVLRAEGEVWRYDYLRMDAQYRGEKEANVYAFLRDELGATAGQASAVIVAAQRDAEAREEASHLRMASTYRLTQAERAAPLMQTYTDHDGDALSAGYCPRHGALVLAVFDGTNQVGAAVHVPIETLQAILDQANAARKEVNAS